MVQAIIDDRKTEDRISPAWIATEAMAKLGATELQQGNPLVYLAAHLHLRQIARHVCRKQFDDDDADALDPAQQEMFPGLQSRYPTAHSGKQEPSYVMRDAMTAKDVTFNVKRLRHEGATKLGRARALEAWRHRRLNYAASQSEFTVGAGPIQRCRMYRRHCWFEPRPARRLCRLSAIRDRRRRSLPRGSKNSRHFRSTG
jgi:hypothetical protein